MTALSARVAASAAGRWLPRRTARLRLTMLYGCLFTLCGAGLLGFTFWLFDQATAGGILPTGPGSSPAECGQHPKCSGDVQLPAWVIHAFDLHTLLVQSSIALAVMTALAFGLGWLVAGRVLRPLRAITATARAISASSLHERLAMAGPDDEFKELADTLDGLFARLEASFTAQRNFVASAAHELRTPLTLDKTLLQVALRNPRRTAEQWRATGAELLESGLQQERVLEALLTLATSEAGIDRSEPADLAKVATDCLASVDAGHRGLHVETSLSPAPLLGDPELITRLAANLLDNAVRHNVPGGTVEVSTAGRDGRAVLTVANSGPVIPPGEIARLLQPFQRLAATRSSDGDGHGLGLPIVRAVATAHGAALSTRARPGGGLHVQVSFPVGGAAITQQDSRAIEAGPGVVGF